MVKGSKHTPGALEKLRIARLGKPGWPHKKGVPISKNAVVVCVDCGVIIEGTTVNRKRCTECKKKVVQERINKFKRDHAEEVKKANNQYWKRIRAECPERVEVLGQRYKQWYEKNKEYCREQARKFRQENPDYRAKLNKYDKEHPELRRIRENRRRAIKRGAQGSHTRAEFYALCEAAKWACAYCGESLIKKTASEDHIIALSKGGSDFIDNIAPACMLCNIRKNARSVEEFKKYLQRWHESNYNWPYGAI